jgi:magnesium chelatase subunit I
MVFSANPEDYTNRGRIVTPLKDRIGSVIRTHYPRTIEESMQITRDNAWLDRKDSRVTVEIPRFMGEIIEEFVRLARISPHVNQQSGVSVRASITCTESMVSNAERRGILLGEPRVMPRISDLPNVTASCRGKIELMLAEDELAEDKLIAALMGEAVKSIASNYFDADALEPVVEQFAGGKTQIEIGDDVRADALVQSASGVKGLVKLAGTICRSIECSSEDPTALASAIEFVLEAGYVNNRLSKYAYRGSTFYKR